MEHAIHFSAYLCTACLFTFLHIYSLHFYSLFCIFMQLNIYALFCIIIQLDKFGAVAPVVVRQRLFVAFVQIKLWTFWCNWSSFRRPGASIKSKSEDVK